MRFTPAPVEGAWIVDIETRTDGRGSFSRVFCAEEFAQVGLNPRVVQGNLSHSRRRGTLRGMHYQVAPALESKYVRCIRGGVYDAMVDLRPDSPTYLASFATELTADNRRGLFVPPLCAHGYLTLTDDTEVEYLVSHAYAPHQERGLRWDDPVVDVAWPVPVEVVSDKDRTWPDFVPPATGAQQ